jgi:hypothetical protein
VKKLQNHTRAAAADEATRLRQSEEKVKYISEQLANALADITAKDNLVKQHAKVAEEAVSGTHMKINKTYLQLQQNACILENTHFGKKCICFKECKRLQNAIHGEEEPSHCEPNHMY